MTTDAIKRLVCALTQLLPFCLPGPGTAIAQTRPNDTRPADRATAPPPFLAGKTTGIIVLDAASELAAAGHKVPPGTSAFAGGNAGYRWFYVPCPKGIEGDSLMLRVGERGAAKQRFESICLANQDLLRGVGIRSPYALVELEVNGGAGSPATDSFVATHIRVLSADDGIKLNLEDALTEAKTRYGRQFADGRPEIDKALRTVLDKSQMTVNPQSAPDEHGSVALTWLADSEQLAVTIVRELTLSQTTVGRGTTPRDPTSGRLFPTRQAGSEKYGTVVSVQVSGVFQFSRDGTMTEEKPLSILPLVKTLARPE